MKNMVLSLLVPVIVGPLTFAAMQALKVASATVDKLPPIAKRFAVAVIAVVLTVVGRVTGVDVTCDPESAENCLALLERDEVKAIIGASLAFALHWVKKLPKDAGK